mgnify:FL=1|tara:strand:+ start:16719 stop:18743 length:2025 start_codon:yes stop_codon:yes gene_type:complete
MATTIQSSALDFNNIKSNLKTYLANKEEFKDYNFEASGLSNILDVLAYNTHLNALTANFALNESYLGTAQLRSSMVSLAEGIGYVPDTRTSSQALVRLFFNTSTTPRDTKITLPAYTSFTTSVDDVNYTFSTISDFIADDNGSGYYEFKTSDGSTSIPIFEGTRRTKTFIVGQYEDNPVYVIPDGNLDADTVTVKVYNSVTSTSSTTYQNIINATTITSTSTIYILKESPNGYFELSFGDGETFGVAPTAGTRIEVDYISTSGNAANGASAFSSNQVLTFGTTNTFTSSLNVSTVSNSVGGDTKETIESIRKNAPFQYATQNRMVTAEDYTSLILRKFSTFIDDIVSFGGEDAADPEFGAVFTSIKFKDDVSNDTQLTKKREIIGLASQLAITSFNLRFIDPITTTIEADVFFQFNPKLTDTTENQIVSSVQSVISNYFSLNTGKFKQSFRRSNLLSLIDDIDPAILSSRADIRMQNRFTPTAPSIATIVQNLTLNGSGVSTISAADVAIVVDLVTSERYKDATNHLISNSTTQSTNYAGVLSALTAASSTSSQTLRYPVAISEPSNIDYVVTSNQFIYEGKTAFLRNKLSDTAIQIVAVAGEEIILDSVGSYDPTAGTASINYFNPTSIIGGDEIKLAVVPANPSAISPTRNEILSHDPSRSLVKAVIVNAVN